MYTRQNRKEKQCLAYTVICCALLLYAGGRYGCQAAGHVVLAHTLASDLHRADNLPAY